MSGDVTRASLLSRVKNPADEAAWCQFEALYHDLLVRVCRRGGLQEADADDVVQTVMANLVKSLPKFAYDRGRGRFRDYLFRCTDHAIARWAARPKGRERALSEIEDGAGQEIPDPHAQQIWEDEWMAHHYRLAMRTIRETFEQHSVEIFDRSVAGETVVRLAAAFNISQDAVHKVRQRIKARMEELIALQIAQEDDVGD